MEPGIFNDFEGDPIEFWSFFGVFADSEEDVSESLGEMAGGVDVELTTASGPPFTAIDHKWKSICGGGSLRASFSDTFLQDVTTAC